VNLDKITSMEDFEEQAMVRPPVTDEAAVEVPQGRGNISIGY